jgi:hypothetical protein
VTLWDETRASGLGNLKTWKGYSLVDYNRRASNSISIPFHSFYSLIPVGVGVGSWDGTNNKRNPSRGKLFLFPDPDPDIQEKKTGAPCIILDDLLFPTIYK